MEIPKCQEANQYLARVIFAGLVAGFLAGSCLLTPCSIFTVISAAFFSIAIFCLMFWIIKLNYYLQKNFDDKPVVEIEEDFKRDWKKATKEILKKPFTLKGKN